MRERALLLVGASCLGACSLLFRYDQEPAATGSGGGKGAGGTASASASSASASATTSSSKTTGAGGCGGVTPDDCSGKCVNLQANAQNCKTCGTACTGTKVCELGVCIKPRSCKSLHQQRPELPSAVYELDPDGETMGDPAFLSYCEMIADDGGWTLLMKVPANGSFPYDGLWSSKAPWHPERPDFDQQEAKLPGCFNLPTDELRLGMKSSQENVIRWITVPLTTPGLCQWFMWPPGQGYLTTYGVNKWRELIKTPSTAPVICYEGVNVSYVRLGVVTADTQANCKNNASAVLGFGISLNWYLGDSVGDIAKCCSDNNNGGTSAFGYIMAR